MNSKEFQNTILPIKNTLFRLAKRVVGEASEAEDVVQEVFVKIWNQRSQLTEITNIEAWCMRLTKNLSIDKLRSKHRRTEAFQPEFDQVDDQQTPYQFVETNDTMQQIENMMNALPEKQKMVMHLRDIEGLAYQEIADALEIPINQVKVYLFRARKQMRERILSSKMLI
ncbi:MAG: RNA polymerase sigma-70 factor (family 1) [Paraglaciecola sp.]|jgi:RNA polymerase sigma-70 factor (family 1)